MIWYCNRCKCHHQSDELCPYIAAQLKAHPEWLSEAANFTVIAGQHHLITTQALDSVAQQVNSVLGTNLTFEGTNQCARDIQVFKRLNDEAFKNLGVFQAPEKAAEYLAEAANSPGAMTSLNSKLTGYAQEVDWLIEKEGSLRSLIEKSSLLNNNAAGIDGITVNRFTGKIINRTTVKSSINPIKKSSTAVADIKEALSKGTLTNEDVICAPMGMENATKQAGINSSVNELNTSESVRQSNSRLKVKIENGAASTSITAQHVMKNVAQGAVIGAAVSLTISSISNYVRYKNGEISKQEAFRDISEDCVNGALVGGAMAGIALFLPQGALGFIAGMAIGIYVGTTCKNVLDEIFGKGAFGAILDASGYVYGMAMNLAECVERVNRANREVQKNIQQSKKLQREIDQNFDEFEKMKE